jgi:hypothetical protein
MALGNFIVTVEGKADTNIEEVEAKRPANYPFR